MDPKQIIKMYDLKPLPQEGGYYRETYRSDRTIPADCLPEQYSCDRTAATTILYLITDSSFSAMHRVRSDEIFHFYLGDTVTMLNLYPDGSGAVIELGCDIEKGQRQQVIVPSDSWQGCFVEKPGGFALLGTTVSPGFEFEDFQGSGSVDLIKAYPQYSDLIKKLTRRS